MGKGAYYNEIDPYAAQWIRNLAATGLIPAGDVDERSIEDVHPDDLRGYAQCHFFAGIAGWAYALRLAEWPDDRPVWTGSCPCQPFSSASHGKGGGLSDERHLWPFWRRLVASRRPATIFGEQVARAGAWLDQICDEMEGMDYAFWSAVLPACSVGKDHVRERIYFAGYANDQGQSGFSINAEVGGVPRDHRIPRGVVQADGIPSRMAVYRAFGNAIVPQVAAEFVRAYLAVRAAA